MPSPALPSARRDQAAPRWLRLWLAAAAACVVAMFLPTTAAQAQSQEGGVQFQFTALETQVGEPVELLVRFTNVDQPTPPEPPVVEGLTIKRSGRPQTSEQFRIFNGQSERTVTTTFTYEITPTKAGRFTVPAMSVTIDGREFKSDPTVIVATGNAADDAPVLYVDVVADPENPMVGEPTTLTLRIWVRPYRNPQYNVTLNEGQMWSCIDLDSSSLGLFKQAMVDMARANRRPKGVETIRDDRSYYVYSIQRPFTPTRVGAPEIGDLSIVVNWPKSVRQVRDFFNQVSLEVKGVQEITAQPAPLSINVRPLPTDGQPAFFNGAVGRFKVEAIANPTRAAVGDPITITYTVTALDDADVLDGVQAPPFASIEELSKSFRIPSDPPPGTVNGRRKVFTQTFRPLSDKVHEIPAIPFASFDPSTSSYRVVASEPIKLEISGAERMNRSQIVGATAPEEAPAAAPLKALAGGLLANAPPSAALLRDDRVTIGTGIALAAVLPPSLCLVLAIRRRVEERRRADPARLRAAGAAKVALAGLANGATPDAILAALTGYIADRCTLPDGHRTRGDAVAALRERDVPPDLVDAVDRLLGACERARYAPRAGDAISLDEARSLIGRLERTTLRRGSAVAATNGGAA